MRSGSGCGSARRSPSPARPRCSWGAPANGSVRGQCRLAWLTGRAGKVWICACIRTFSGTHSPRTCLNQAVSCAVYRSCSATPTSPRRRSTLILTSSTLPAFTTLHTRGRAEKLERTRHRARPSRSSMADKLEFDPHGTTIVAVRRNGAVAMGGDGQVTLGNTVMKGNARKVRRLFNDKVLAGFAGGTADAFTLFERFEGKLEKYGNLTRAAIELAKGWRSDRYLRRLEALLLVGDADKLLLISGNGDVIEPDYDVAAIGSGGQFALAAARALLEGSSLDVRSIVERSLNIAADICIYTNRNLVIEELKRTQGAGV